MCILIVARKFVMSKQFGDDMPTSTTNPMMMDMLSTWRFEIRLVKYAKCP